LDRESESRYQNQRFECKSLCSQIVEFPFVTTT
jgi:hypothetical protein